MFFRKTIVILLKAMFILVLLAAFIFGIPRLITALYSRSRVITINDTITAPAAIVFGAGLNRDRSPTPVLRDRVATAVDLYKAGKVKKILMSGDNRTVYYNEPGAMAEYAIELGVPANDIVLDYAGRRTYDTCYRAHDIFGLTQAVLITQRFHLPRALYTCNMLGIEAKGISADRRTYWVQGHRFWQLREIPATLVAMWDLWVRKPLPVLGQQEPIFPVGMENDQ
jgi:SanA protein